MPNVIATPRSLRNGEVITEFTDTTSTTAVTYTYPLQQAGISIENSGVADVFVTVGSFTNQVIKSNKTWKVDVSFTSFSIRSDVNSQEFTATAFQNDIEGSGEADSVARQMIAESAKNFKSTVQNESPQLGPELLDSTGWSITGWTGSFASSFSHVVGQITPLIRNLPSTGTKMYQVSLTLASSVPADVGGLFSIAVGSSQPFDTYRGGGTTVVYEFGIQSVQDGNLVITPNADLSGTISNISVKEILSPTSSTLTLKDSDNANSLEIRNTKSSLKNVFIGTDSGEMNTTGNLNTTVGHGSMAKNTSGYWNAALGVEALASNTVGSRNIAIGRVALNANISGHRNVAVGTFALNRNTHGAHNIAIGADSLWFNTTGNENVGVGYRTLAGNRTGNGNTAVGHQAGDSGDNEASYNDCTLVGKGSGTSLTTGANDNTFLGRAAGWSTTTGTGNILIGKVALAPSPTSSNALNIGNFLYGDMTNYLLSVGKSISSKGLGTGVKLQVGRTGFAGYLELLRSSTVDSERIGCINFINEGNTGADANTRETVAYIATDLKTTNANANGNSGGALKFFTKPEGGGLTQRMVINDKGNVGIGIQSPTALLHLYPGSNVAGTAPLKFNTGTLLTVVENGAVEFDGNNLYITINGVRKSIQVA